MYGKGDLHCKEILKGSNLQVLVSTPFTSLEEEERVLARSYWLKIGMQTKITRRRHRIELYSSKVNMEAPEI